MMYLFLLVVAIVVISLFIYAYFSLSSIRRKKHQLFYTMDANLKKRHEYVDDLVEVIGDYTVKEDIGLDIVIQARDMARLSKNLVQKQHNENILSSCLESLFLKSDNCVVLKEDKRYFDIKIRIELQDKQIFKSIKQYDDIVKRYSRIKRVFPLCVLVLIFRLE